MPSDAAKPNAQQLAVIDAILSIFETGTVQGNYPSITFSEGDKGQLTYGKHQTTLASGNLAILVDEYVSAPNAVYKNALKAYLPDLQARHPKLNYDTYLKNLLRAAADGPVMRAVQDEFFAVHYRKPAFDDGVKLKLTQPLSWCIRYDGQVHGSWKTIADRTTETTGKITPANERNWMSTYVALRRAFLAAGDGDLPKTVYRMDVMRGLIEADSWDLAMPLVVRGFEISPATLAAPPAGIYDGPASGSRDLRSGPQLMVGQDVRRVQLALSRPWIGYDIGADGKFGKVTGQFVAAFQTSRGLPVNGVVNKATLDVLQA